MNELKHLVTAIPPATTNGALTGDYINLANCQRVEVAVILTQAVGHATAITIEKATSSAGAGSTAITEAVPIYAAEDTGTTDVPQRQTDAVSYTVDANATNKLVRFLIDPALLGEDYSWITVKTAASSQASNFAAAVYVCHMRYDQDSMPSVIA